MQIGAVLVLFFYFVPSVQLFLPETGREVAPCVLYAKSISFSEGLYFWGGVLWPQLLNQALMYSESG